MLSAIAACKSVCGSKSSQFCPWAPTCAEQRSSSWIRHTQKAQPELRIRPMPSNVRLPTPLDKSLCLVSHLSISFDQEAFCDSTPPCLNSGLARTMVAIARRHASSPSLSLPLPLCQPCRSSCPAPPPPLAPPPMLLPLKRLRRLLEESALFRFQLENNRQVGGREHHAMQAAHRLKVSCVFRRV